uniref:Uncharacterized protein n=1 Tax=Anguilla anguilla TaxID=7936 RepID=A0A0E9RAV6_ANGAN
MDKRFRLFARSLNHSSAFPSIKWLNFFNAFSGNGQYICHVIKQAKSIFGPLARDT